MPNEYLELGLEDLGLETGTEDAHRSRGIFIEKKERREEDIMVGMQMSEGLKMYVEATDKSFK